MKKKYNLFKSVLFGLKLFWYSLLYGMDNANKLMFNQNGDVIDNGVHQNLSKGGVMDDLLEQRVTKEVEEIREKHYRILKEADKYDASTITMTFDEDGNPIFSNTDFLLKKTYADFMKHPPVYETEDTKLKVIQDNKMFEKEGIHIPSGIYDYDTILTIDHGNVIPRFQLEKFVTKMAVREQSNPNRAFVDFYMPTQASQFGKIDAILISNLFTMFETRNFKSDLIDFKEIEWVSNKAWNSEDMCLFKYDDIKMVDMNVFDGSFVLTFDCNILSNGKSIVEKYMTKEMDEKYNKLAPKKDVLDFGGLGALKRRDDKLKEIEKEIINLENTIIKV